MGTTMPPALMPLLYNPPENLLLITHSMSKAKWSPVRMLWPAPEQVRRVKSLLLHLPKKKPEPTKALNLHIAGEVNVKNITELPHAVHAAIRAKFELDYCGRPTFQSTVQFAGLKTVIKNEECFHLRLLFQNKGRKARGVDACTRCCNNGRLCVRPQLVDENIRFCVLPPPAANRRTLDWKDKGYWLM
jgi:hypothetical protein